MEQTYLESRVWSLLFLTEGILPHTPLICLVTETSDYV